ncbi:MAG TPA: phosphate ABC transporter substrate-binding protein PstS [Actinocrinis sp.]|nr:phosphate ABC transporter substrate-binding protein PstS [Actinocrinis sp.]
MKQLQRYGALAGAALIGMSALSACGSDNNGASSAPTSAAAAGGSSSAAATSAIACASGTLAMAGSTAQTNAISQWTKDYQQACSGATINYTANGSGAGVTSFTNGQALVAGSDYPLSSTQQPTANTHCGSGSTAIDIPAVPGAIAIIFNVPGVTTLNLSAKNLVAIFSGTITNWNDAAIKADNPSANLPNLPIQTFHRADTSGTSFNFSNYLNGLVSTAPAANKQFPYTAGTGETGSSALAAKVKATSGGIGYAEYSYATSNSLSYAEVSNASGAFVPLTQTNANNFIAKAKVAQTGSDTRLNFDYTYADPAAYPAVLVTYEIVCSSGNAGNAALIKGFLNYVVSPAAQGELTGLGYVPLPSAIATADATAISSIS